MSVIYCIQNLFNDQYRKANRPEFFNIEQKVVGVCRHHNHVFLQVFSYYRSLPMPITSHKFGSIDPISGKDTEDDNGQFVSSVCWRGKSDMLIAANSSGCVKVLQMV